MTSLQLGRKARELAVDHKVAILYKKILREIPRVMEIYEIVHVGKDDMKRYIRKLFDANAHLKDQRVIDMLVERGYMDLEDTLLQHKQKTHLMTLLQGKDETNSNRKALNEKSTAEEFDARWLA